MCNESYYKIYKDYTIWYKSDAKPNEMIFHRTDGPAIEYSNGTKSWFINGKGHREDGPAIEWADGHKEWYINGKPYSEEEYWRLIKLKAFI